MHILISCFGSAGDVHPFIAIGQTLKARGHAVEVLTSPFFRERIARAGLDFVPVGTVEDYQQAVDNPLLWDARRAFDVVWEGMRPRLAEAYERVRERVRPDTVLVGSTLAWSARMAQEKLGLPLATVHLAPACLFSALEPAVWPGMGWMRRAPTWLVRAVMAAVDKWEFDRKVLPDLNRLRAELQLPPTQRVLSTWMHSPDKVICAFPDWFAMPQADWPPHSVATGFPLLAAAGGAVLDPMLERFLSSGPAPVVFTPGSAMAHGRDFFARALAACDALGRRAVFVTPYRDQLPAALPPSVRHAAYVPFDLLAPRAAVFVHHGGVGTSAQCLAVGVPQVVVPRAHDQFDNGARLARLGVAAVVRPDAPPADWARALMHLSSDATVAAACNEMAGKMAASRPLEQIANEIERLRPAAKPGGPIGEASERTAA